MEFGVTGQPWGAPRYLHAAVQERLLHPGDYERPGASMYAAASPEWRRVEQAAAAFADGVLARRQRGGRAPA